MYPAYQISKLNERRAVTSPQMRCDITRLGLFGDVPIIDTDGKVRCKAKGIAQ